jgi:hypothetical protein
MDAQTASNQNQQQRREQPKVGFGSIGKADQQAD